MTETSSTNAETGTDKSLAVRNTTLLALSQATGGSNQAVVMSVGALTGAMLAPSESLATVPTSAMIIGLALSASPATFVIYRLGRRYGFMLGTLIAMLGGVLACLSVLMGNFYLFSAALILVGAGAAFSQQYRFAVADSVAHDMKARAISYVMLGGIAAGLIGPKLAYFSRNLIEGHEFAGSYLMVTMLSIVAAALLYFTRLAPVVHQPKHEYTGRSLPELLKTPEIFVPIISAMASYALMTFVMVAAPLAMVHVCGLPVQEATDAIQWHIVAMFAPSFFTPWVIKKLGTHLTTGIGLVLILLCAATALNGLSTLHFDIALVFLGIGWNFGFIGATSMLTSAYRPEEAARVQGLNEQLVFGTMAVASIFSGVLLNMIGWQAVNVLVIPVATAVIALLAWSDARARKARQAEI
ncbi:MAG: MFS transporter [Hyphomicrobiaceae bacterium]|nr:MFS transporter [Hyphomicrobiaceae bacterium]MCC0024487.1 MFS transporter [Hyphomicrobiaceae bacterium]